MNNKYQQNPISYVIYDKDSINEPEKKLDSSGPDVLSLLELVKVVLGDKVEINADTLNEYVIAGLANSKTVEDVQNLLPLSKEESRKILAILSIGKRFYQPGQGSLIKIRNQEDVFKYCQPMAHLTNEQLKVLLVNSRYQLVYEETIAIGQQDKMNVAPIDVFHSAVERRVGSIILVHNHPSGDTNPSDNDFEFTSKVVQAGKVLGVEVLDHLIISPTGYQSCLKND